MSEHTPGPWFAMGTRAFGLSEVVSSLDHPRHYICGIPYSPPCNPDRAEREANARLIALAPALLELVEEVMAGNACYCEPDQVLRCRVCRAHELINKVRGGP